MPHARDLAKLLRDRSRWPSDFVWDYCLSEGCALRLARKVLLHSNRMYTPTWPEVGKELGLSVDQAEHLFFNVASDKPMETIEPNDLANLIDEWFPAEPEAV